MMNSGLGADSMADLADLQRLFDGRHIDYSRPGFYDDVNFAAAERQNPKFLEKYAEFIEAQNFSADYLQRARTTTLQAVEYLYAELRKDGRLGACIDLSLTLSRFLEREEIWNYFVAGALGVYFPEQSRLRPKYLSPIMAPGNPARAGHAWLKVPPFVVVDVTLPLQPFSAREAVFITRPVVQEISVPAEPTIEELVEPEAAELFEGHHRRLPTMNDLPAFGVPHLVEFMREFPAFLVTLDEIRLKYVPTAISAPDAPLERMHNLCLSGKYPVQLYDEWQQERR
jgi:hypothetical protein